MGLRAAGQRLRAKLRYSGFPRVAFDGLARLGIRIAPYYLMSEDCTAEAAPPPGGGELAVVPIAREDLPRIAALPGASRTLPQLLSLYDAGKRGLAVVDADQVAAYCWYDLVECTFPGHRFPLAEDAAYLFDAYTHPRHRGSGLAPFLRSRLYGELAARGRRRLYSVSGCANRPALRFKAKLGARILHVGVYVGLFGRWQFARVLKRYPPAPADASARYAR